MALKSLEEFNKDYIYENYQIRSASCEAASNKFNLKNADDDSCDNTAVSAAENTVTESLIPKSPVPDSPVSENINPEQQVSGLPILEHPLPKHTPSPGKGGIWGYITGLFKEKPNIAETETAKKAMDSSRLRLDFLCGGYSGFVFCSNRRQAFRSSPNGDGIFVFHRFKFQYAK